MPSSSFLFSASAFILWAKQLLLSTSPSCSSSSWLGGSRSRLWLVFVKSVSWRGLWDELWPSWELPLKHGRRNPDGLVDDMVGFDDGVVISWWSWLSTLLEIALKVQNVGGPPHRTNTGPTPDQHRTITGPTPDHHRTNTSQHRTNTGPRLPRFEILPYEIKNFFMYVLI
jgi:hypothetical protein